MFACVALMSWLGRRLPWLRGLLRAEAGLTSLIGLFDREHYLAQINPADLQGLPPIKHYVLHGDAHGLSPSPLFDLAHYDAHCGQRLGLNRLLHYALVAHFRWRSPTPWFDPQYYLRRNPEVGVSAVQAVWHFQWNGWRESRNPLPGLDIRKALHTLAGLRPVKGNPLSLLRTEDILRLHQPSNTGAGAAGWAEDGPAGQSGEIAAFWADVRPRAPAAQVQVDVVVYVSTALPQTLSCLHHLLAAPVQTAWRLLVIQDEYEDSDTAAWLRSLAARDLIEWLEPLEARPGDEGGGSRQFLHAMQRLGERDLVLLDSHTLVHGDWLDRLCRHMEALPDLAALTTLSDDGGVAAYPEMFSPVAVSLESRPAELDTLAAQVNSSGMVRVPALLPPGCVYLRQKALQDSGLPRERPASQHPNGAYVWADVWERLQARGWGSAIACDVFLGRQHLPGQPVPNAARQQVAEPLLAEFIASDPLAPWRARLDLARLRRMCRQRNALLVCHSRGGGTERHLLEQTEQLIAQGWGVFELRPVAKTRAVSLRHIGLFGLPNLGHVALDDVQVLAEVMTLLRITDLHIHHLIDFPPDAMGHLVELAKSLQLAVHVAVHDYYLVCPRVNMVTTQGRFCGQPTPADCDRCLATDGLRERVGGIEAWRHMWQPLLRAAQQVVVPTHDVAQRLRQLLPEPVSLLVQAHEQPLTPGLTRLRQRLPGQPLRVLVIGAIGRIKGFDVMLALAQSVQRRGWRIELSLLGFSPEDGRLAAAGVRLLGPYFDADLPARIAACDPDLIWVPSIWPETYCYVLSAALRSGCQVAVFDLGAQAERARSHDARHLCLPLSFAEQPEVLAQHLMARSLCSTGKV